MVSAGVFFVAELARDHLAAGAKIRFRRVCAVVGAHRLDHTAVIALLRQEAQTGIQHLIQRTLAPYGTEAKRLSQAERLAVVEDLYKNGLFVLKGSVYALAQILGVSEPTIYRYLNRIKKENHNAQG